MAVIFGVAARMLAVAATVIITHKFYEWLSDKVPYGWAYSRSPDPEIFEEATTTTTFAAAAAVATPPAAEQIQFEEDVAFIKGEFASALDSIGTANDDDAAAAAGVGGGFNIMDRWISNIDPQVLAKVRRVAGRIGWVVVDSIVIEGSLPRGSRVALEVYYAVRNELRRSEKKGEGSSGEKKKK